MHLLAFSSFRSRFLCLVNCVAWPSAPHLCCSPSHSPAGREIHFLSLSQGGEICPYGRFRGEDIRGNTSRGHMYVSQVLIMVLVSKACAYVETVQFAWGLAWLSLKVSLFASPGNMTLCIDRSTQPRTKAIGCWLSRPIEYSGLLKMQDWKMQHQNSRHGNSSTLMYGKPG